MSSLKFNFSQFIVSIFQLFQSHSSFSVTLCVKVSSLHILKPEDEELGLLGNMEWLCEFGM
jgi:hypothetical protein